MSTYLAISGASQQNKVQRDGGGRSPTAAAATATTAVQPLPPPLTEAETSTWARGQGGMARQPERGEGGKGKLGLHPRAVRRRENGG